MPDRLAAPRRPIATRVVLAACCAAPCALAGCYERTIRAEGWDYEKKSIQKPLAPDGPVDDLIFGDRPVTKQDEKPQPRPAKPN